VFDDSERANLLNNHFASVCTKDNNLIPLFNNRTDILLSDVNVSNLSVFNALSRLKSVASGGTDFLPSFLVKYLRTLIAYPLCLIFKLFLSVGS